MKIGDKVRVRLSGDTRDGRTPPREMTGTVVYIHPKRRFYLAEFRSPVTGETFRESFLLLRGRVGQSSGPGVWREKKN